jgi:hypothetical protein
MARIVVFRDNALLYPFIAVYFAKQSSNEANEIEMKKWLKRIRAAVGIGLTWAAAWFAAGMVMLFVVGFGAADVPFPLFFGLLGFLAGATFSGILGLVAGRRRFDQMSLPRFAGWGAAGGVLLAGAVALASGEGGFLVLGPVFGVAGAASAAGTLALARKGEHQQLVESTTEDA